MYVCIDHEHIMHTYYIQNSSKAGVNESICNIHMYIYGSKRGEKVGANI